MYCLFPLFKYIRQDIRLLTDIKIKWRVFKVIFESSQFKQEDEILIYV